MARYLVVHTPTDPADETIVQAPTRLVDMAREIGHPTANPRWIRTYSPDLHDDRIFTLWEADNADAILAALDNYGFLTHMEAKPLRVQTWGPADGLKAVAERAVEDRES
jgi:hypothetical protein